MPDNTDFIKIRVHILIDPNKHFIFEGGTIKWNMESLEEFYDADSKFRDPIITFINDEIGKHNWAIRFQPFFTGEYEAYVYCNNEDDYKTIVRIIQERLRQQKFRLFARRGDINDYIAGR